MWEVSTSQGHRPATFSMRSMRFHAVHSLGLTTLIAPYRCQVPDHRGQRFVAEIHRQATAAPASTLPSYR